MQDDFRLDQRLTFMRIDQATRALLAEIKPLVEPELPRILEAFYQHISRCPDVNRMFGTSSVMQAAKQAQIVHWSNILTGRFDHSYVESVRRIGHAHHRIGLEPRWYIAGYAHILGEITAHLSAQFSTSATPPPWPRATSRPSPPPPSS